MVEQATAWQIPIFFMDSDFAASSGHFSHYVIFDAIGAMEIPLLLVAAWIREYRGSETFIKLDDILNPQITRTRSVQQGDPCAPDLLGAVLEFEQVESWRAT